MKDFLIDSAAEDELIDALVWHHRYWRHTGRDFHADFLAEFAGIRRRPTAYAVWRYGYRMRSVPGVPYTIYYLDLPSAVWIAAIAHNSRRTGYWLRRRPPRP